MNISDKVRKAAKRQYEENNMNEKTKIKDEKSDLSKEDVDPGRDGLLEEAKEPCLRDEVTELKTAEERLWNPAKEVLWVCLTHCVQSTGHGPHNLQSSPVGEYISQWYATFYFCSSTHVFHHGTFVA